MSLVPISRDLSRAVDALRFGKPVTHVYNPLDYARVPHEAYLSAWGRSPKRVLLVGMNPGPFGMAQTGVPFATSRWCATGFERERQPSKHPRPEHPKRPVLGFDCTRTEVSGTRLWAGPVSVSRRQNGSSTVLRRKLLSAASSRSSDRNFTPDKLPAKEREPLFRRP